MDLNSQDNVISFEMSEVVLTRLLEHGNQTVSVQVGRPVPFDEQGTDCYVPFRIEGLGSDPMHFAAGGVDGVQAMLLALTMIGDTLAREEGLTLYGDTHLGFPTTSVEPGFHVIMMRSATE